MKVNRIVPLSGQHQAPLVLSLAVLAAGCGGGPTSPPAAVPAPRVVAQPRNDLPADPKADQLVEILLRDRSVPAMRRLMAINGVKVPTSFELRSPVIWQSGPADVTGVVSDPAEISSEQTRYIAALLTEEISGQPLGRALFFDRQGRLLRQLGSGESAMSGRSALVTSLGLRDTWFVEVRWPEPRPPFTAVCDYYLVGPGFPRLLRVWHRNNVGYSFPPPLPEGILAYFEFDDPDNLGQEVRGGIDARGTRAGPDLFWHPKEHVFKGPSTIRLAGKPLYEVDLGESPGFKPSDR